MKKIYIIGAGGCAKDVCFLINDINKVTPIYKVMGFIDYNPEITRIKVEGEEYPIIHEDDHLNGEIEPDTCYAVAVGNPIALEKIIKKFGDREFPNLIHPSVIKAVSVKIGRGNVVKAGCIFTTDAAIGSYNILNLHTTVGHDTIMGDGNVANPAVNISGGCNIGDYNLFGTNATILQYLNLGSRNIIGASTLINKPIEDKGMIIGVPGRKVKDL